MWSGAACGTSVMTYKASMQFGIKTVLSIYSTNTIISSSWIFADILVIHLTALYKKRTYFPSVLFSSPHGFFCQRMSQTNILTLVRLKWLVLIRALQEFRDRPAKPVQIFLQLSHKSIQAILQCQYKKWSRLQPLQLCNSCVAYFRHDCNGVLW